MSEIESIRAKLGVLTTEQAAALLGLAERTLANWRSAEMGPRYIKVGTDVLYRVQAIEEWMMEQEQKSMPSRPAPRRRA